MATTKGTLEEIDVLIRARYPIIYVVSWEEQRVESWILDTAVKQKKRAFTWSFSTGIVPAGTAVQAQKVRTSPTKDPLAALDHVIDQLEPAIYVFKDLHPFLGRNNFAVIRRLKDIAVELKNSLKTIVLISPMLELPCELEKEVTVVDFPLPEARDFEVLLGRIMAEVHASSKVKLTITPEARERLLRASLGLTLSEAENVFAKILVSGGKLTEKDVNAIFTEKRQIIRKNGLLDYYESDSQLRDVGGLELLKDWLAKRSLAFGEEARGYGLPAPKGVLMLGVQGCGKSLCAKAVSSLWNLPLLRMDVGRLFGSLVGSSEDNLRRAIRVAESIAPCVLWIDEIDKAMAGSRSSGNSDSGTAARVFGTFLTWLSEKATSVFVIATANDISALPPELLRKGRFDEIFFVDLPNTSERRSIFEIHLRRRKREPGDFDLDRLVPLATGFSGAEIEEAVVSAMFDAFSTKQPLATEHVAKALRETVPLSKTMEADLSRLRTWADGRARMASPADAAPEPSRRMLEMKP